MNFEKGPSTEPEEISEEEFLAAAMQNPGILKSVKIEGLVELIKKIQEDIDSSESSPEKKWRQEQLNEVKDFYQQRMERKEE